MDARTAVRMPVTAVLALVVLALIDLASRVPLGPVSVNGAFTLAVAVTCLFLAPTAFLAQRNRERQTARPLDVEPFIAGGATLPVTLILFVAWAIVRLVFEPSAEGLQNVAVYVVFAASIAVTAVGASASTSSVVLTWMRRVAVLVSIAFIFASFTGDWLYGARSFALVALVYLAVLVPHTPEKRLLRFAPYVVFLAVVLSLSRTAAAIALVLLLGMVLRGRRGKRLAKSLLMVGAAAAAAWWLFANFQPLRERFFGGDNAVVVGDVMLNTSGRANLWALTVASAEQSPWFGWGPGTAGELTAVTYYGISHPHNEYLRIWHDLGFVGLALFVVGMGALMRLVWKRARATDQAVHWSALLALISVLVSAITDNPLVYLHVMLPVGVLVGLSLSGPVLSREKLPERALTR